MNTHPSRFARLTSISFLLFACATGGTGCGGDDSAIDYGSPDAGLDASKGGAAGAAGQAGASGGVGLGGAGLGGASVGGAGGGGAGVGGASMDGGGGANTDAASDSSSKGDTATDVVAADNNSGDVAVDRSAGDATSADGPVEASTDASGDAGTGGDAADAGPVCGADNTACSNNGSNGLCKSQACAACVDPGDDANCVGAYGVGNLCLSGACVLADCRVNADCASSAKGSICGATQPNMCGKCTSDSQCGAAQVCNTVSGACVSNVCTVGQEGAACAANATDVCCSLACVSGNCCPGAAGDAACKVVLGSNAVCSNHTCTSCNPVQGANPVYLVDPVNGNDNSATGSGTSGAAVATPSCRFATITRALQAIGPVPAAGTTIQVMGPVTVPTVGNVNAIAETFPINVTRNIFITASGGLVTVRPPVNGVAFVLNAPASGINGNAAGGTMVIDGAAHAGSSGVSVGTGSTDGTLLRNVTIQNFAQGGIIVTGTGILGIREGVSVIGTGIANARRSGLRVTNNARVNIIVPNGAVTSFNNNTQHGILVDVNGSVNIQGAQVNGTGTIEARGNFVSGLAITQTPGAAVAANTVNGLVAVGTTNGNGIRIQGGSNVTVRNSYSLGNAGSGVVVATSVIGNTRNNSLANIVLGNAAQAGANVFQATLGSNANIGAGICLQVDPNSGTLAARGNFFSGGVNCATTAAVLTWSAANCGGQRDLGLAVSRVSTMGNDIDVNQCTHP